MKRVLVVTGACLLSGACWAATPATAPTPAPSTAADASPLTLAHAFELAATHNERMDIQAEEIEQAKALYRQTRGASFPNLRFNMSTILQEDDNSRNDDGERNSLAKSERTESKFMLRQPIFQGFKEFAAMSALKASENREQLLFQRQATLLYQDVAAAFYQAVFIETELFDLQALMELSKDRITDLKDRSRLGKSRNTETTTAESQYAVYRAREAGLRGDLVSARETLSYLIGVPVGTRPLVDSLAQPSEAPAIEGVLERLPHRSDIAALREEVRAREAGLRVARANYSPSLVATGNYYVHRPSGSQKEIDWDALFSLDVPLYQGGAVRALNMEARSFLRQTQRTLDQVTRLGASEVRQAHAALASSIEEARLLEEAHKKSRRSFDLLNKEYRLGLVNNLDVLQATNDLQTVKRDFDLARLQSKLNLLNLRLVAEMSPETLP